MIWATPDGDSDKERGPLNSDVETERALQGLTRLVRRYRDPNQGYISRSAPQFAKLYTSDYDHLARVFEWSTSGEEADE